jgi:hypothetical protein
MFNVLSDIHLEKTHAKSVIRRINSIIPHHRARFLLLAGDIGDPFSTSFWRYIETQSFLYEKVFFVTGNKEYNLSNDIKNEIRIVHQHIHEQLEHKRLNNVYFLDERSMELEDFFIIGTTLWTNIPKKNNTRRWEIQGLPIPRQIVHVSPSTQEKRHNLSKKTYRNDEAIDSMFQWNVKFLETEIQKAHKSNPNKPIIVLTHFSPTKNTPSLGLEDYFHSVDLEAHVPSFNLVNTYVYGHTHLNPPNVCIYNKIRYISNQVGHNVTKVLDGCHLDFSFLV